MALAAASAGAVTALNTPAADRLTTIGAVTTELDGEANLTFDGTTLTLGQGQIAFPATQVASAGANTLDDYEEGTFTPGITFGGGATGMTFSIQLGRYTKVGRQVSINLQVLLTAKGTSTGAARLTGVPFTNNATVGATMFAGLLTVTFADYPWAQLSIGGTTIDLNETTNAGVVTSIADTDFANTSEVVLSGVYSV